MNHKTELVVVARAAIQGFILLNTGPGLNPAGAGLHTPV
jgi:hypothetical protein